MSGSEGLPDLLSGGLKAIICGTAVGDRSRSLGAYYAGRGNKFWKTLHSTGLTDRLLVPEEWRSLTDYGIGLTDLCKNEAGMDHQLSKDAYDVTAFKEKLVSISPRVLAFNGLKAARVFYGTEKVFYGRQKATLVDFDIWVLPSTSGAANSTWDLNVWHEMACAVSAC